MELVNNNVGFNLLWWISVVEIPVIGFLFFMIRGNRKEIDENIKEAEEKIDAGIGCLKNELANYKLYSAKEFASVTYLKDVENRLTNHLLRIEEKLENNYYNKLN